ncbi:MAG: hypothetical protein JXR58_10140 [Bacteroidales bacterium]|nr:hypothetical protein [Bacteroidales bacterium]
MNKILIFLSIILLISSCRKGEDDPLLSLRSRENRLTGYWTLNKMNGFHKIYDENGYYKLYQAAFNSEIDNSYYYSTTFDVLPDNYYYEYFECRMLINDDNTMEVSYRSKGVSWFNDDFKGSWYWKNDPGKNKEYVQLTAFFPNLEDFDYQILRLKNKELILVLSVNESVINNSGEISQIVGEYVYEFHKTDN